MIANFAKSLRILVVLALSIPCNSLATVYYVNASNATPGAGTSWATAFKDLNQALAAVSSVFDQVWVAKGTYYPTTTTNRNATFSITQNLSIYGGFSGGETLYTQANPVANPTILSGDIGVPGDASDNSYHVVTYASPGTTNVTMDGFTITGGNANQNYPAVTAPSPGNTGGGFLETASSGQLVSAAITHCNFVDNFAVYGGGFGAYGDASSTFFTVVYSKFTNNSAFVGGALASLGYNNDWSVSYIDMCVFVNDLSVNSQGSAVATMNTNGSGNPVLTTMTNDVIYNCPQPQLYNLVTNATSSSLQCYTSIIWNSVAPYTGPLYAGNNVLIDMCDLDLVTPMSSNLDIDPQFTNAAGGDFHTPHCSPLVDQGFSTSGFNMGHTDPDGNARMIGPKTDIGLYESSLPPTPTVANVQYCQYETATALTATPLSGYSLLWYTVYTGGTGDPTAPTPSTATASVFSTYYYVSQVDALGCEGPRAYIAVKVNAAASAPTATSPTYCQGVTASALSATGTNLLWYTAATGGTGDATAPTPSTTGTGSTDYWVTQTPASSCESGRTMVTVTINAAASAPTATSPTYCQGATASALSATGSNLLWYTAATGGTGDATAPTPSTTGSGTTDYWVTQTPAGSCESGRTPVTVTISTPASAPTAASPTYCQGATASALSATGSNLLWYTAATGGTGDATAPTPSTTGSGATDYWVTQTPAGSCESGRTAVTVTIKPGAAAPIAGSPNYCQGDAAATLSAMGSNLLWYTAATGGTGDPASPMPSTVSSGMTSYFVSQTLTGGCESPRTEVDVTVNPIPSAEFTWSNPCVGKPATIMAANTTADLYAWDFGTDASVSGSGAGPYTVTWANSNTYTITLTASAAGCHGQTQHQVQVNSNPTVSIIVPTVPLCQGNSIPLEATGAASYQWSPATDLSDAGVASPMALLEGNIQYTVTGTNGNGCSASAQISLDISPDCMTYYVPGAFTPNGDGKNDAFRVKTGDIPKSFVLAIFNRFGGKVFESTNVANGWNGSIGGTMAPAGTYVYTLQATTSAGAFVKRQGTIILLR